MGAVEGGAVVGAVVDFVDVVMLWVLLPIGVHVAVGVIVCC